MENQKFKKCNGQIFKSVTVKKLFSTFTDLRPSNQFIKVPKAPGPHFKSCLTYRRSIIWCGTPCPAVYYIGTQRPKGRGKITPYRVRTRSEMDLAIKDRVKTRSEKPMARPNGPTSSLDLLGLSNIGWYRANASIPVRKGRKLRP